MILRTLFIYIPIIVVVLAIVTKLLVLWAEPRLAFYPLRGHTPPPQSINVKWKTVIIETDDGERLVGWYAPARANECTVLFLHGNAGNLNDRADLLARLAAHGLGVMAIDYRGYGSSTGSPTEQTVYADAEAAYDYLRDELDIPARRIVAFGRSLGGAIATELAVRKRTGGLILEGTFTSARRMARRIVPFWPVGWFMTYRFDTITKLRTLRIPKIILSGTRDNVIPHGDSIKLFEAAAEPKELMAVEDAGHMDIYVTLGAVYFNKLTSFCRGLGQRAQPAPAGQPADSNRRGDTIDIRRSNGD